MTETVGATHHFDDETYAREWAGRFTPTPGRVALFDTMIGALRARVNPAALVIELGSGPGYFAERLLDACPAIIYRGLDTSAPMRALAGERLKRFAGRASLTELDITAPDWPEKVKGQVEAVVTTWALHDLGGQEATRSVYQGVYRLLASGGTFLNGDFVKPEGATQEYEPGRFPVALHLAMLREAGFAHAEALGYWEPELTNPTPSQNYACLVGYVS